MLLEYHFKYEKNKFSLTSLNSGKLTKAGNYGNDTAR